MRRLLGLNKANDGRPGGRLAAVQGDGFQFQGGAVGQGDALPAPSRNRRRVNWLSAADGTEDAGRGAHPDQALFQETADLFDSHASYLHVW